MESSSKWRSHSPILDKLSSVRLIGLRLERKGLFFSESFLKIWHFSLLVFCCLVFVQGIRGAYEFHNWDEAHYLLIAKKSYDLPAWAPLYVLYLKAFLFFLSDFIQVYFWNFALLGVALSLLAYGMLRRLGAGYSLAFLGGILVLVSNANIPLSAKVNHFNLILLGLLWLLSTYARSAAWASILLILGMLPTIYVRQDNFICILVLGVMFIYDELKRGGGQRAAGRILGLLFVLLVGAWGLTRFLGDPFGGGYRAWNAFKDHYCWRHYVPGMIQENTIRAIFGASSSISAAAFYNPRAFLEHGLGNARALLGEVPVAAVSHVPIFLPVASPGLTKMVLDLAILFVLAWAACRPGLSMVAGGNSCPAHGKRNFRLLTLALGLKAIVAATVFSPWTRYYLEFLFFLTVAALVALGRSEIGSRLRRASLALPLIVLSFMPSHQRLGPRGNFNFATEVFSGSKSFYWNNLVQYVKDLHLDGQVKCRVFGSYWIFFGSQFDCDYGTDAPDGTDLAKVASYVKVNNLRLFVIDDSFRFWFEKVQKSRFLDSFERNYAGLGFARRRMDSGTNVFVYFKGR
jgi:hypothetical protein